MSRYLAILLLAGFAFPAAAYCPPPASVKAEFFSSDIVLTGKVVAESDLTEKQTPGDWSSGENYTVAVTKTYRGHVGKTVTVFSEDSSGMVPMDVGTTWLIFAVALPAQFGGKHVYQIDCGGSSGLLADRQKELLRVKQLAMRDDSRRSMEPNASATQANAPIVKVSVLADGKLLLDGEPTESIGSDSIDPARDAIRNQVLNFESVRSEKIHEGIPDQISH